MRSATDDHAQPSHPSLNGTEQETTITVDGQAITDSSEVTCCVDMSTLDLIRSTTLNFQQEDRSGWLTTRPCQLL